MAGPVSLILLNSIPTATAVERINEVIDSLAKKREGTDFYLNTNLIQFNSDDLRPFGIVMNTTTDEVCFSAEELVSIEEKLGFSARYYINLYAMCNKAADHQLLGLLTLRVAEETGGLIDFCGYLEESGIDKLPGQLYAIDCETTDGKGTPTHFGDAEFMKHWIAHKNFHMIK